MSDEPQPLIPPKIVCRRLLAILLAVGHSCIYFLSFARAENDAYCCGHHGFIHNPSGLLLMLVALIAAIPVGLLAMWMWRR